jgi:hypothetical protein
MNYEKIYNQLIDKAKSEMRSKTSENYFESHHITPRCLGGSNAKENLVLLTAREHYIAHKLLYFIYPNNQKLSHAFWCMVSLKSKGRDYKVSSREYQEMKLIVSKKMSGKNNPIHKMAINPFKNPIVIEKIRQKNLGRKLSDEAKKKISDKAKGRKASEETKLKIANSNRNRIITQSTRDKLSFANKGKAKSPEQIEKIRQKLIGKPCPHTTETNKRMNTMKILCPHCGRTIGGMANFKRFHNDNCKSKTD